MWNLRGGPTVSYTQVFSEQVAGAPAPSVLPKDPLPVLEMVRVKMYRVMRLCWCIGAGIGEA